MAIRAFLALDIDEQTRGRLGDPQRRLGQPGSKIKWVAAENLHVTLQFLGGVAAETLTEVCSATERVASRIEPFDFHVRGVICVPPRGRVRMLWAGATEPAGRLVSLYEKLADALAPLGFEKENRPFKPHITLARIKFAPDDTQLRDAAGQYAETQFGTVLAEELVVYSSQLKPDGPVYTPIARAKLGG